MSWPTPVNLFKRRALSVSPAKKRTCVENAVLLQLRRDFNTKNSWRIISTYTVNTLRMSETENFRHVMVLSEMCIVISTVHPCACYIFKYLLRCACCFPCSTHAGRQREVSSTDASRASFFGMDKTTHECIELKVPQMASPKDEKQHSNLIHDRCFAAVLFVHKNPCAMNI